MTWISLFRWGIFILTVLFSLAMLAMVAHMASTAEMYRGFVYDFQALALACSVLSTFTLAPFVIISLLRNNAWFVMNIVEIPVVGILWALWLSLSILCTQWQPLLYPRGCPAGANSLTQTFCKEFFAIEAISFISWILLLLYIVTMITACIIGKSRGHSVWIVAADVPSYFAVPTQFSSPMNDKPASNVPNIPVAPENTYMYTLPPMPNIDTAAYSPHNSLLSSLSHYPATPPGIPQQEQSFYPNSPDPRYSQSYPYLQQSQLYPLSTQEQGPIPSGGINFGSGNEGQRASAVRSESRNGQAPLSSSPSQVQHEEGLMSGPTIVLPQV